MRQTYTNLTVKNTQWGTVNPDGTPLPPFRWVHVENRGANPIFLALRQQPGVDLSDAWRQVPAGASFTGNVEGEDDSETFTQLWLIATGGAATPVAVELSDRVIVSLMSTP